MLRSLNSFRGVQLYATDGHIGKISEFFFEDRDWTVLYMAADTGDWLPGKRALVPPASLGEADWVERKINVMVTREDIESSPNIDLHQPITREQEVAYFAHFGWACLWDGELRSSSEVIGLPVVSGAVKLGRVDDLVIDDQWIIRYLAISSGVDKERESFLMPPRLLENADWRRSELTIALSSDVIRSSPAFEPGQRITRDHEVDIYRHFSANPYWE